jgi:hypothetical protein
MQSCVLIGGSAITPMCYFYKECLLPAFSVLTNLATLIFASLPVLRIKEVMLLMIHS